MKRAMFRSFPFALAALLVPLATLSILAGCRTRGEPASRADKHDDSLARVQRAGVLLWGADVVGGVPYVYEDPHRPDTYIGFEMTIAQAIADGLGVQLKLVIKAWDTLIPELQRGSFDLAMNGIEDTEDRDKIVLFSEPYFVYAQQLTVRKNTSGIASLDDLRDKRVATLSGTAAEDILRQTAGVQIVTNPEIIYSYRDLEEGKVEAVLLDTPIAAAYGAANPKLQNVGQSFGEGRYVIAFRKEDKSLRDAIDRVLQSLKQNGELKRIYERWGIMDQHQAQIGIL
jgi:polar amino acid transport system substrate-binding protein